MVSLVSRLVRYSYAVLFRLILFGHVRPYLVSAPHASNLGPYL